eukprot:8175467-Pyramimonas_sp.AAC.1
MQLASCPHRYLANRVDPSGEQALTKLVSTIRSKYPNPAKTKIVLVSAPTQRMRNADMKPLLSHSVTGEFDSSPNYFADRAVYTDRHKPARRPNPHQLGRRVDSGRVDFDRTVGCFRPARARKRRLGGAALD